MTTRKRKKFKIRKKIKGTADFPRISVFKSLNALSLQVIDDDKGNTICSAINKNGKNIKIAKELGKDLAKKMKEKSILKAKFDKNGYSYHGVIKSLVESIKESGIAI